MNTSQNTSQHFNKLIDDVEDLLSKLADEHSPEINALSNRVADAIGPAKRDLARNGEGAVKRVGRYAMSVDRYITGFPRLGFLTGMLVGGTIVYLNGIRNSVANS